METNAYQRLKRKKEGELKKFALSFAIGMAILLAVAFWKNFHLSVKIIAGTLSLYHLFARFVYLKLAIPSHWFVSSVGGIIGNILSDVIFGLIFYLAFTPIVLILRLAGKDQIKKHSLKPMWEDVPESHNDPKRIEKLY